MNWSAIARLLSLRYRLQWAKVRSRNGRVALFVVAVLALAGAAVLMALGGGAIAFIGVRARLAFNVALGCLATVYVLAVAASIFMGIGVDTSFSNAVLRRYPLSSTERFVSRHVIAVLDPIWLLVGALDFGVAAGFGVAGATSTWMAPPAAAVLLLSNVLLARLLVAAAGWVAATPAGPAVSLGVGIVAALSAPMLGRPETWHSIAAVARFSPPGAMASIVTGSGAGTIAADFAPLLVWVFVCVVLLARMENLPAWSQTNADAPVRSGVAYQRIGSLFGPTLAPLVGKMLRYYVRSPQLRWNYPLVLPGIVMMAARAGSGDWNRMFVFILGALAVIGLCTGVMSLNVFGFDGSGVQEYFVLPVRPADVLERLCDRVAIITRPGALVWEGDITPFAVGQPVAAGDYAANNLEDLFFRVSGRRYSSTLDWM